jgi:hypothetical protein
MAGTLYAIGAGMKRKRVKIPPLTARHLIPSTLRIHVFTEQAEAALNRAILGHPVGEQTPLPAAEFPAHN